MDPTGTDVEAPKDPGALQTHTLTDNEILGHRNLFVGDAGGSGAKSGHRHHHHHGHHGHHSRGRRRHHRGRHSLKTPQDANRPGKCP